MRSIRFNPQRERGDTDTAIEEEMHGDLQTSDNVYCNNIPHTTTNRTTSVKQPQQALPQNTAKTTPVERPLDPKKRKQLPWWPSGNIVE
jgi:hypothetical protein